MNLAKREYWGLPVIPASAGRLLNTPDNLLRTSLSQVFNPMNPAFFPEPACICKAIVFVYTDRKHLTSWSDPIEGHFSIRVYRNFGHWSKSRQRIDKLRGSTNGTRVHWTLIIVSIDC